MLQGLRHFERQHRLISERRDEVTTMGHVWPSRARGPPGRLSQALMNSDPKHREGMIMTMKMDLLPTSRAALFHIDRDERESKGDCPCLQLHYKATYGYLSGDEVKAQIEAPNRDLDHENTDDGNESDCYLHARIPCIHLKTA